MLGGTGSRKASQTRRPGDTAARGPVSCTVRWPLDRWTEPAMIWPGTVRVEGASRATRPWLLMA